jgi:hypothetical protein
VGKIVILRNYFSSFLKGVILNWGLMWYMLQSLCVIQYGTFRKGGIP